MATSKKKSRQSKPIITGYLEKDGRVSVPALKLREMYIILSLRGIIVR